MPGEHVVRVGFVEEAAASELSQDAALHGGFELLDVRGAQLEGLVEADLVIARLGKHGEHAVEDDEVEGEQPPRTCDVRYRRGRRRGSTVRCCAGVTDRVDVGGYFTKAPGANYGFFGGQVQYAFLHDVDSSLSAAGRLGFVRMYGPEDLTLSTYGVDFLVMEYLEGETLADLIARLGPTPSVGTSSVRRIAQLMQILPNARFSAIRGNLDTRLRKLDAGEHDALVLAAAGLCRLGFDARISFKLPFDVCVPAPGQGIIAIEIRADDEQVARAEERTRRRVLGADDAQRAVGARSEARARRAQPRPIS